MNSDASDMRDSRQSSDMVERDGCFCEEWHAAGNREVCNWCLVTKDWSRGPTPVEIASQVPANGRQMVERVAAVLQGVWSVEPEDARGVARRILEASHHAELVASNDALRSANRAYVETIGNARAATTAARELLAWYGPFNPTRYPPEINGAWLRLEHALTKIGGEA